MTEATWDALDNALRLLRSEIHRKEHQRSVEIERGRSAYAHTLSRELARLYDNEKELMWLADLYRPRTPEEIRETIAKSIYMNMEIPDKPDWVPGGKSELQEIARTAAEKAIENIRQQVKTR